MKRVLFAVLLTVTCVSCTISFAQTTPLRNPGFDIVVEGQIADWVNPDYWSGEFVPVTEPLRSGRHAAQLSTALKHNRHWGRIHSNVMPVTVGLQYRFSVWARGTGELKLGVINYLQEREGKPPYESIWQEQPTPLGEQWQEVVFEFTPVDVDAIRVALMIEVEGENAAAVLDDADFQISRSAEGEVRAPAYMMIPAGDTAEMTVDVVFTDGMPHDAAITLVKSSEEETEQIHLALTDGRAEYAVRTPDAPELIRLDFVQVQMGTVATTYVDVVDEQTFSAFAEAAGRTAVGELPVHLLFLGDSLTDFLRGHNYTDQVAFWLNRVHGGEVSYRNAGIGGDFITRMWQRLNGEAGVHRLHDYDDLYEPVPQRIFILLGHNDTRLSSGSDFTQTTVAPEDFRDLYTQTVNKLKVDTGAQVTILSSTSSVYEITRPRAEAIVESGRPASLFGKPELLEQFNEIAREVAGATGAEYLDVYEPTKNHPDKPSLFTADGVHMTLAGHHLVALELLKHLGR